MSSEILYVILKYFTATRIQIEHFSLPRPTPDRRGYTISNAASSEVLTKSIAFTSLFAFASPCLRFDGTSHKSFECKFYFLSLYFMLHRYLTLETQLIYSGFVFLDPVFLPPRIVFSFSCVRGVFGVFVSDDRGNNPDAPRYNFNASL